MYPHIDASSLGIPVGGGLQGASRPTEYRADAPAVAPEAPRPDAERSSARVAERTAPAEKPAASDSAAGRVRTDETPAEPRRDQATFNLAVTREERESLVAAIGGGEEAKILSAEEKEMARTVAERIGKHIDEAIARSAESRSKVEKAVTEWYARLSRGESRSATELIDLLHKVALGRIGGE